MEGSWMARWVQLRLAGCVLALTVCLFAPLALAAADEPIATLQNANGPLWVPHVTSYRSLALTVVGPANLRIEREFAKGASPSLSGLPDGRYKYELRLVPPRVLEGKTRATMAGTPSDGRDGRSRQKLDDLPTTAVVQWGTFAIRDGALVEQRETES